MFVRVGYSNLNHGQCDLVFVIKRTMIVKLRVLQDTLYATRGNLQINYWLLDV